jgi:Flp pilus assembly pilin Flp
MSNVIAWLRADEQGTETVEWLATGVLIMIVSLAMSAALTILLAWIEGWL